MDEPLRLVAESALEEAQVVAEPISELGVVFFNVPIGSPARIEQPQPEGCAIT
jgi:hypothetical protein